MSNYRYVFIALSFLQVLSSYLFHKYGALVFFLDESSEIHPVREMASIGSEEDFGIIVGMFLFSFVMLFELFRIKRPVNALDHATLLFVLVVQFTYLCLIDTGSFILTMQQEYGWILVVWFITYGSFWFGWFKFLLIRLGNPLPPE